MLAEIFMLHSPQSDATVSVCHVGRIWRLECLPRLSQVSRVIGCPRLRGSPTVE